MIADPSPAGPAPAAPSPRGTERDERLDLLRGLFVLHMIVVHLGWKRLDAHYALGWATAAEGFFLVSGATLGLVVRRFEETGRLAALRARLWRRGAWLYGLNLLLVAVAFHFRAAPPFRPAAVARHWAGVPDVQRYLSFDHALALDVLPRYAVLLLAAAALLPLLRRARAPALLVAGSLVLWAANLATGKGLLLPLFETPRASFPVASWQLLFCSGLALALACRPSVARGGAPLGRRGAWLVVAMLVTAGLAIAEAQVPGSANATRGALAPWVDRETLGPLRLLNVATAGICLWLLCGRFRAPLSRWLGGVLLPLGRSALAAFVLHLPLLWLVPPLPWPPGSYWWRQATALALALAISQVVRWRAIRRALMPV